MQAKRQGIQAMSMMSVFNPVRGQAYIWEGCNRRVYVGRTIELAQLFDTQVSWRQGRCFDPWAGSYITVT